MHLSCQEHLLPGDSLIEKWDNARRFGFEAIELLGYGEFAFEKRLPELKKAKAAGVVMPTVCVIMLHFIGDFDKDKRKDALANMKSLLSVMGELGGLGAVTPAAYGLHSRHLPPFDPPRSDADTHAILMDALQQLGDHAKANGVHVLLEPLNRYEDYMLNTLEHGVAMCRTLNHPTVKLMGDLFHMSIEEQDMGKAIIAARDYLVHIHVADSNRFEPGQAHTDFTNPLKALKTIGFKGSLAYECRLKADADESLPRSTKFLKGLM